MLILGRVFYPHITLSYLQTFILILLFIFPNEIWYHTVNILKAILLLF